VVSLVQAGRVPGDARSTTVRVYIPADICLTIPDCDEAEMVAIIMPLLEQTSEGGGGWDKWIPRTEDKGLPEDCEDVIVWRSYDPERRITSDLDHSVDMNSLEISAFEEEEEEEDDGGGAGGR